MKPIARTRLVSIGKLLDWIIDSLRETLNADAVSGGDTNDFTREEWKDAVLVLDRLDGANSSLCSITTQDHPGDGPPIAECGTLENPHPDDGEIYDDSGYLHIHVGRECLAIVKNHNPDKSESDEDRTKRLNELRFMVTGARKKS